MALSHLCQVLGKVTEALFMLIDDPHPHVADGLRNADVLAEHEQTIRLDRPGVFRTLM